MAHDPAGEDLEAIEKELEVEDEVKPYDPKIRERIAKIPDMLNTIEMLLSRPQFKTDSFTQDRVWQMRENQAQIARSMMEFIDLLLELDGRKTAGEVKDMLGELEEKIRLEIMVHDGVDEENPTN